MRKGGHSHCSGGERGLSGEPALFVNVLLLTRKFTRGHILLCPMSSPVVIEVIASCMSCSVFFGIFVVYSREKCHVLQMWNSGARLLAPPDYCASCEFCSSSKCLRAAELPFPARRDCKTKLRLSRPKLHKTSRCQLYSYVRTLCNSVLSSYRCLRRKLVHISLLRTVRQE